MIEYFIIGSGGFAKEVHYLAESSLPINYIFSGFIDIKPSKPFIEVRGKRVDIFDEQEFLKKYLLPNQTVLFIGVGNPKTIAKIAEKFKGFTFPNLIHKCVVGDFESIKMGNGNIITAYCNLTVDIKLGNFNIINLNSTIGHDAQIGDFNVINPGCNISGEVKIGSCNLIGTNATILQGVTIGDNNILGASSLANRDIDSGLTLVGVPAKPISK